MTIESARMTAGCEAWPNGLGVDVGSVGEVWLTQADGCWGVRTFTPAGEADRWLRVDPAQFLFLSYAEAVALCQASGHPIE